MTLEQSIKQLDQFRRMLKPGTDIDRALECVLAEVKKKDRPVYNPTNQNQNKRREEYKKEKAVTGND